MLEASFSGSTRPLDVIHPRGARGKRDRSPAGRTRRGPRQADGRGGAAAPDRAEQALQDQLVKDADEARHSKRAMFGGEAGP